MLIGTRFRLRTTTMAIGEAGEKRTAVIIPAGEVVRAISSPTKDRRMVDVLWNGRAVTLFAVDLEWRGEQLPEAVAAHN